MTITHKDAMDTFSMATAGATIVGWLPAIAAAFSIIWTVLRIYDWIQARRNKRRSTDA